ncbi:MAG TPA: carboxypeptidase-like regulatory domain-containing protein [Cyclobacteriaceae bacterium]|nr:carboxypeptidase-like regulatory domain-containing protein [Cyclobacteriaceae bacterium]
MKKLLLLFAAVTVTSFCYSQKTSKASLTLKDYGRTHFEEKIFLHVNSNFFLTGESLLFNAYCLKAGDNSFSALSKVAYVELIGPGATPALQAKIALNDGTGFGDFFLPSTLASGNYTLIGYTAWMKNYSVLSFFQTPITIVNPFKRPAGPDVSAGQKTEVKFYPEGGSMVADVKNVIGFRGKRGTGTLKFAGKVLDQAGKTITEFSSTSRGVGKFSMTPGVGEEYKVVIVDSAQNVTFTTLPRASATGVAMEMAITSSGYQFILASKAPGKESFTLLIHQGNTPYYELGVHFSDGIAEVEVPVGDIPPGISQVSILNSSNGVECARLIWKRPGDFDKLKLSSGKSNYKPREHVGIELGMQDTTRSSRVSVSVRKMETELTNAPDIRAIVFGQSTLQVNNDDLINARTVAPFASGNDDGNKVYLPEVRGNLITGTVADASGNPAANQSVYLSAPSKNYQFYASKTDSAGRFFFNAQGMATASNLVFTLNTKSCPDCKVTMDHSGLWDYKSFTPSPLTIDSAFKKLIERRSILTQIENAYYVQKQDSVTGNTQERFYGKPDKAYMLDDYVRFPTMEDVFIEYVTEILVKKSGDQHDIKAMNFVTRQSFTEDPLILLDGVPLFDMEQVMNYNPLALQKIEVVGRRYFYGPLDVQGIISLSTYEGDVANISLPERFTFTGMQPRKKYYSPNYRSTALDKIPDYRVQLYWNPEVTVTGKKLNLDFFASDIAGDYEIVVEGMQSDGNPVYQRQVIHVGN